MPVKKPRYVSYTICNAQGAWADNTTYYSGLGPNWTTTDQILGIILYRAGKITKIHIRNYCGTPASAEGVSLYLRKGTTDYLIQTKSISLTNNFFSKTNLNITVAEGDLLQLKLVTPIWATNPVNIYWGGLIVVECP